jgi:hypothetical protein
MWAYRYSGETIHSGVPLPELSGVATAPGPPPRWRCGPVTDGIARPWRHVHDWRDDAGATWLRIARDASAFRLAFAIGPTFFIEGESIVWVGGGVPSDTVRHLLLDQVLPLAMSTRGSFGLHGSAVDTVEGALAFVGPSGLGKSTLAARFASRGSQVLADDHVVLDEHEGAWRTHSAYPGLRLWRDAVTALGVTVIAPVAQYTSKQRSPTPVVRGPRRLRRVYLLDSVAGASPVALAPASAADVTAMIRCAYRLDVGDRAGLASDFAHTADLIEQDLVRWLRVPRDFARLDEVVDAVKQDARTSDAAARACRPRRSLESSR